MGERLNARHARAVSSGRLAPHLLAHVKVHALQPVVELRHEAKGVLAGTLVYLDQRTEQSALVAHVAPRSLQPLRTPAQMMYERCSHHSPVRHVGVQRHLSRYERTAPRVPAHRAPTQRGRHSRGNIRCRKVGKSGPAIMHAMAAMQP